MNRAAQWTVTIDTLRLALHLSGSARLHTACKPKRVGRYVKRRIRPRCLVHMLSLGGRVTMPPSLLNTISNAELNSTHRFVRRNCNKEAIRCGSKSTWCYNGGLEVRHGPSPYQNDTCAWMGKDGEGATGIPPAETLRENCSARNSPDPYNIMGLWRTIATRQADTVSISTFLQICIRHSRQV